MIKINLKNSLLLILRCLWHAKKIYSVQTHVDGRKDDELKCAVNLPELPIIVTYRKDVGLKQIQLSRYSN